MRFSGKHLIIFLSCFSILPLWGNRSKQRHITHASGAPKRLQQITAFRKCPLGKRFDTKNPTVRVLLGDVADHYVHPWKIKSEKGFKVIDERGKVKMLARLAKEVTVSLKKNGYLYVNNRRVGKSSLHVVPLGGTFSFKGKEYYGYCYIKRHKGSRYFINSIDLERYVASVLRSESWPGWPLEVNKVQAITSRTYVISMMQRARSLKKPYDVHASNIHQTYNGVHDSTVIKQAVAHTKGVFLSHEGKPILAMFDSCCGGIVPAKISGFDFSKAPYLARKKKCKFCKRCWIFNWKAEYEKEELEAMCQKVFGDKRKLKKIKVTQRDKAGLVKEVLIKRKRSQEVMNAQKMYSMVKGVKSFYFDVEKKKGTYVFTGKGYGHHIGLCQWGAREMVRDGWRYKKILAFYYPGTKLMKLA